MEPKLFTPAEANRMLPLISGIVKDILKAGQAIREISVTVEKPEKDPKINELMDELEDHFSELDSLGCSYRDWNFSEGLVDFPAKVKGREVYLCWKSDEDKIAFYHDLESGYTGRLVIPKELL